MRQFHRETCLILGLYIPIIKIFSWCASFFEVSLWDNLIQDGFTNAHMNVYLTVSFIFFICLLEFFFSLCFLILCLCFLFSSLISLWKWVDVVLPIVLKVVAQLEFVVFAKRRQNSVFVEGYLTQGEVVRFPFLACKES